MRNDQFEQAFSDFLESKEYDSASGTLFQLSRAAFEAGWKAAAAQKEEKYEGNEDRMLYMARLITLYNAIDEGLTALRAKDPAQAEAALQEGIDRSDGMLGFWNPDTKDYDDDFRNYLYS